MALGFVVTVRHCLMTRICSEKFVIRWFCHCASIIEWTDTNLHGIAYYIPRLHYNLLGPLSYMQSDVMECMTIFGFMYSWGPDDFTHSYLFPNSDKNVKKHWGQSAAGQLSAWVETALCPISLFLGNGTLNNDHTCARCGCTLSKGNYENEVLAWAQDRKWLPEGSFQLRPKNVSIR